MTLTAMAPESQSVLVSLPTGGWLKPERVVELTNQLRAENRGVTLKVFKRSETAAAQGHVDNPTLANEFIFDWIASRLGSVGAPAYQRS